MPVWARTPWKHGFDSERSQYLQLRDYSNTQLRNAYMVSQKSKPDNFCNNFVYREPIFVIFATCHIYTIRNLQPAKAA